MLETLLDGRYKIITQLGSGGFGQTYLAEDTRHASRRRCVVKQFKPSSNDSRFLEIARRLFEAEADILGRLGQHDQIPELYDSFEEDGEFYLVQEFIDGHPLSEEFANRHRLNEPEAVSLLQDVLGVLEFVHTHQVIHRDIKPGNLIRRRSDGKIVLIDFGAVKELHTQLSNIPGQTGLTVGIGTQGYTPSEQLMGRPRYCSDLYALGMTAIQAVTGFAPAHLPEDPQTSDLRWRDRAAISPGLAFILDCMVRYDYTARYQSAAEVKRALQKFSELPTDLADIPPSLLLPEAQQQNFTQVMPWMDWRSRLKRGVRVVAIATVAVTGLVLGMRQLGWLNSPELAAYDQMTRLQIDRVPDPRLLVVGITEADLQALGRATPSDESLSQAIAALQQLRPRVIGLDLYRDLPQEPGQAALQQQLQTDNVITIFKIGDGSANQIPSPPGVPAERTGFSDLAIDPDNVIRRNLMFGSSQGQPLYSFATQLALRYLSVEGVTASPDSRYLRLGNTTFYPLEPSAGGYQNADAGGYQILLRYRSRDNLARQVSLSDVLQGKLQPDWVQDKIVLIGTVAPSGKDLFYTPFSASERTDHQMPGVVVHAQMVSQILGAALDQERLFGYWPNWVEVVWISGWALAGSSITWLIRHPLALGLTGVGAIVVLSGSTFLLFNQQCWIPVAAPAIALLLTGIGTGTYRSYWEHQQQRALTTMLWDSTDGKTITM